MDVLRMAAAAGGVLLIAGTGMLAWRCHAKGLIGRRRALAIAGCGACTLLSIAGFTYAFAPRVHYVEPVPVETPRQQEESQTQAISDGGRVSYTTTPPNVDPASSALPERQDDSQGDGVATGEQTPAVAEDEQPDDNQAQGSQDHTAPTGEQTASPEPKAQQQSAFTTSTSVQVTPHAAPSQSASEPKQPAGIAVMEPTGTLTVDFIDAGSGSCALITLPDSTHILVGSGQDGATTIAALSALGVEAIDTVVLTGPQAQEAISAADIMSHIRTSRLAVPVGQSSDSWNEALEKACRTGAGAIDASGIIAEAGGAVVEALPAGPGRVEVMVTFGGRVILLCGDEGSTPSIEGRVDILDVAGSGQPGSIGRDSARTMWPQVSIVGSDVGEDVLSALGMSRILDTSRGQAHVTVSATGTVTASGQNAQEG